MVEHEGGASGRAELVTIGEFARLSRLSAKALRRYDELGLLRPALVDPVNGYRYYDRAQAETARLVAWLRRIGMPLARIAEVVALDHCTAAAEIRAYWARVEAETAARRELASFLVDHLSAKENAGMSNGNGTGRGSGTLGIRYAALAHPARCAPPSRTRRTPGRGCSPWRTASGRAARGRARRRSTPCDRPRAVR